MLTDIKFDEWCKKNKISKEARSLIENIRSSPPSRQVSSGICNVSGRYPSKKMGCSIQYESRSVELHAIYDMEHSEDVLEYYDQPPMIKLNYKALSGKKLGFFYTPDYFVIRKNSAGWEEWKPESKLEKLSAKDPNRYFKDESGRWRCPPAEAVADLYGLYFRTCSSAVIDRTYVCNIQFLEDYLHDKNPSIDEAVSEKVANLVKDNPGISLKDILERSDGVSPTDIYILIASGKIFVDLQRSLISTRSASMYISKNVSDAFACVESSRSDSIILIEVGMLLTTGSTS